VGLDGPGDHERRRRGHRPTGGQPVFDALGPPSVFALAAGFVGLAATLLSIAAARGAFKGTPDLAKRGA
jgi:hypothetical protein